MKNRKKVSAIGVRHLQSFLLFILLTIAIGMRAQLSIALVAMTDSTTSSNPDIPVYDWTNKSTILSSFSWGYLFLQILAGNLGRIYGTKHFLLVAMFVNATFHCLVPVMASVLGSYGVILCRVMQGLSQGFFYPNIYNLLSKWAPQSEVATLGSLVFAGAPFGTIISMPLVGYISSTWWGWPASFYVYGGAGFLWIICYYFFGADSPDKHPSISISEKTYIESDLEEMENVKIPWRSIVTNIPFWIIWINSVSQFWSYQTLLTEMPTYMNKIMKFDIQSNGMLSSAPYILSFVLMVILGNTADYIINKGIISVIWARKIFNLAGCFVPGTSLLILGFIPDDATILSVILLVLAVGLQSASNTSLGLNHIDISPTFSGVILGMVNSSGSLVSILGPMSVQFIVNDETDKTQWRIIFMMAAAMYMIPAILFLLFASAEIQSFDPAKRDTARNKDLRSKKHSVISVMSL